jgi:hypothetical protein
MISKISDPAYHDPREGDQSFLQIYWRYKNWGLPFKYNLNIIMAEHHKTAWDHIWMIASVVHYTVRKPAYEWSKSGHCRQPNCKEWQPLIVSLQLLGRMF